MWVYLNKEHIDEYLNKYTDLAEGFNSYILVETKDAVFLPRLFYKNYPDNNLKIHYGQKQVTPEEVQFKFTGKLRPDQVPIVNTIIDEFKRTGKVNGIIKARPGIGKTVMSVYIASKLGLKPCVVVDNDNLMKQWIRAFLDFTDLEIGDIGIGRQKSFGIDKKVCIFMVQTLLGRIKKDTTQAFATVDSGRFGVVFYDEVHNTSASEKYSKSSVLFRTLNILGLSATPFHCGPAEILMKNTIGEILYETNVYDLKPKFKLIYYNSGLSKYTYMIGKVGDYLRKKAMYNSIVQKSQVYLDLITDTTKKLLEEKHKTMILCFTEKQVQAISEALTKAGIENLRFYGKEREIQYTEDVIVATYSFCGKGFDYKDLSALILACPLAGKKSLIQSCGRIVRLAENKMTPIVISLVDLCFPTMFVPDIQKQKKIIKEEFNCDIEEIKWGIE
jgi:superfamily II DNA or RNA helicase